MSPNHPDIELSDAARDELERLRADPADAMGFGGKVYLPYYLRVGWELARNPDPRTVDWLLARALDPDEPRLVRLMMLHVLSQREEPAADGALIRALDDPDLRGTAAYLLGRIGFKGYPKRPRPTEEMLTALARHLDDPDGFVEPWHEVTLRNQDLVLAAFIRLAGPDAFRFEADENRREIGYELARFSDSERGNLLAQVRERLGAPRSSEAEEAPS